MEEKPKRNEALFRQVADHIEAHPETYDQSTFGEETDCGTVACIAGWACVLSGRMSPKEIVYPIGYPGGVALVAVQALGLTAREADLFRASWRPHDGFSVPDALRKIGEGASIEDVSA